MVRSPACHVGGQGFESPTVRHIIEAWQSPVYCSSLENCRIRDGSVSSNLTASAILNSSVTHLLNLSFTKVRRINIDLGTQCNLSCPGCQRTHLVNIGKLVPAIMPVSTFAKIASEENNLDAITFSGALSDPIFSTSLFGCLEHVNTLSNRPTCVFSTNGSGRKTEWWERFSSLLVGRNEVGFAIDGLADTNPIYRVGSNFDSIINGITTLKKCFVTNSNHKNSIVWRYVVFEHNYHQVKEAYQLAKSLGVDKFYLREADPRTPANMKLISRKFTDIKNEIESY